jgi:hypothetical protein
MINPGAGNVSNDRTNIMTIHGPGGTDNGSTNQTMPDLLASGKFQNIGFDISGNNSDVITVYTSRLEMGWIVN